MRSNVLATLLAVALTQAEARGSEPRADAPEARSARLAWFQELAGAYVVSVGPMPRQPLHLKPEAVLRWSSAQVAIIDGAVFLWLANGRPQAVIGPFFAPTQGGLYIQFHSLSQQTLVTEKEGAAVWSPRPAGIDWKSVPDAPQPAAAEGQRLIQMRSMARDFSASAVKGPPNYDPGSVWQLRLMPQPIYRYASTARGVADGAVFAWCIGTDPELFVLIESQQESNDFEWHYALARWCESELTVEYRKRQVWHSPHLRGWDQHAPYFRIGPIPTTPPRR